MDSSWSVCTLSDFASKVARTTNPPALTSPLPVFPHDRFSPTFSQLPPPQTCNAPSITPQPFSHPLPRRPPSPGYASATSPSVQPSVQPNGGGDHYPSGAGRDFDPYFDKAAITTCADATESNSLARISPSYDSTELVLSRRASDRRHQSKDTLHGNEDGVLEEADSNPSSTATILTSSVPLCTNASPQHGLATDNLQSSSSEPGRDPCLTQPVERPIMIEPDDSTVDGSSLCDDFSPRPCPSSSCATSISGSPAAEDGGGKAASTIGGRDTSHPPKRNRPSKTGGMQTMIAVQVPPFTRRPDSETGSPRREIDNQLRDYDRRTSNRREAFPNRKRKRDDDTSIAVLSSSSEDSDGSDDDYRTSSEEESCPEKPSKTRKVSPQPHRTTSLRSPPQQRRSPICGADHGRVPGSECPSSAEWTGGRIPLLSPEQAQRLQCLMIEFTRKITAGCSTTTSSCARRPTAVSGVGSVAEDDRAVDHDRKERRRARWTTDEDDRLTALMREGLPWSEIEERFPHRSPGSLLQRWYTRKSRERPVTCSPAIGKRKRGKKESLPLPVSNVLSPLGSPHHSPHERLQGDDDVAEPQAKSSRPPRPSTSITVCPICKCTVDVQALGASQSVDPTRMRFREQREFCKGHRKETARREWSQRHYPFIAWDSLDHRLVQYHARLRCVLDPGYSSQYKRALDKTVRKHGRASLSKGVLHRAGYYGPRGDGLLLEHVVRHFARDIDSLKGIDILVSTYGAVVYAQEVLVPELLVMLVRDDMGVDAKAARRILKESDEIGDLLNCE
ncbi:hypothetical protein AJ80_04041 [Polytolypa hystricis UAMH7299]|uniref:Restriction of telomere capping protein 4 n=1 Tax=Polytolypa hystricis (strain UAMH7299) TaxID=1447883 RepID=A0A2B7YEF3_POLH7|nr:hypothetical protein AJ80_04041 [Polytolypa hystricis UAMH7299]